LSDSVRLMQRPLADRLGWRDDHEASCCATPAQVAASPEAARVVGHLTATMLMKRSWLSRPALAMASLSRWASVSDTPHLQPGSRIRPSTCQAVSLAMMRSPYGWCCSMKLSGRAVPQRSLPRGSGSSSCRPSCFLASGNDLGPQPVDLAPDAGPAGAWWLRPRTGITSWQADQLPSIVQGVGAVSCPTPNACLALGNWFRDKYPEKGPLGVGCTLAAATSTPSKKAGS